MSGSLGKVHIAAGADLCVQPVCELVFETCIHEETVTCILVLVVFCKPIKVVSVRIVPEHIAVCIRSCLEIPDIKSSRESIHRE